MRTSAGEIPEIRKVDSETGTLLVRDGITCALFFKKPINEVADLVLSAFEEFLRMTPPNALRWASIGAMSEAWKAFTRNTVSQCKAQLNPAAARARKLTSFELRDGQEGGDAPGYGFALFANANFSDKPDKRNLVQMYFPTSLIENGQIDQFVTDIHSIVSKVPVVSGYCSPGLHWSEGSASEALTAARKIAMRYPGFDVQFNQLGRTQIDDKIRGARWLTFLGPEVLKTLGGEAQLSRVLRTPISVKAVGNGVVIRAGQRPEIGDTNRRLDTPLLKVVARVLEPVTMFGEKVLLKYEFADGNSKVLSAWERRFLD